MSEYVSKTTVNEIVDELLGNDNLQASPSVWYGLYQLKQLPTADVAEVVRCKDCKYNTLDSHNPNAICRYGNRAYRYGFCHEAERRNDE